MYALTGAALTMQLNGGIAAPATPVGVGDGVTVGVGEAVGVGGGVGDIAGVAVGTGLRHGGAANV